MLPMPKKLIKQGVKDMVRISDGRMSGTSYGTAYCTSRLRPAPARRPGEERGFD
jgi:dihydroxyacid dehydratase/phosphogluconate dehydratase